MLDLVDEGKEADGDEGGRNSDCRTDADEAQVGSPAERCWLGGEGLVGAHLGTLAASEVATGSGHHSRREIVQLGLGII